MLAYPPKEQEFDEILLMIDNSKVTLDAVLQCCVNRFKNAEKRRTTTIKAIRAYIENRAFADLCRVGDRTQAECLSSAIFEMKSLMRHNVDQYWASVGDYYLQKHAEQLV